MRLKPSEAETIRAVVHALDADAKVYLFGSRVDEAARGGDIDLLVLSRTLSFRDRSSSGRCRSDLASSGSIS